MASPKKTESFVEEKRNEKKKRRKIKTKHNVGDLARLSDKGKVFSDGDTTILSFKLCANKEVVDDTTTNYHEKKITRSSKIK